MSTATHNPRVTLTRELAWAAATDEGNRSMRKGGRSKWNEEDYNVAVETFNELWPDEQNPNTSMWEREGIVEGGSGVSGFGYLPDDIYLRERAEFYLPKFWNTWGMMPSSEQKSAIRDYIRGYKKGFKREWKKRYGSDYDGVGFRGNPARSASQYGLAQAVLSGVALTSSMPMEVAREIVEKTPQRLRKEYAMELAQRRKRNPESLGAPNIRIVRYIRSAHGVILKTEVGGSWFSPPVTLDYIKKQLAVFQEEEPQAGWILETRGTDRGWHHNPVKTFSSKHTADTFKRLLEGEGKKAEVTKGIDGWEVHYTGSNPSSSDYDWSSPEAVKLLSSLSDSQLVKRLRLVQEQQERAFKMHVKEPTNSRIDAIVASLQAHENAITLARSEKFGRKTRRNPEDSAASMYESFHGAPSEEVLEFEEEEHYHGNLAELGVLCEMKVVTLSGYKVDLCFGGDEEEEDEDFDEDEDDLPFEENPSEVDSDAARELELFIENDADLYRQQYTPINKNLVTKMAKGVYNHNGAVKLFMYLMESGAKKYAKEYSSGQGDWHQIFSVATRKHTAERFADHFETEAKLGNYDGLLPKKYQKKGNPESYEGPEGIEVAKEDGEWVVKRHGHITSRHATRDQAGARAEADANLARGSVRRLFKRNPDSDPISSSTTLLCSNEDGNQLYLLGGDQSLDLSSIHMDGDWERDSMVIGEIHNITYRTEKDFDKFKVTEYTHDFSEESGSPFPTLRYDVKSEKLHIDGGSYKIHRPLVGTSPGIED